MLAACTLGPREPQPIIKDLVVQLDQPTDTPDGSIFLKPVSGGLQGKAADTELLRVVPDNDELRISTAVLVAELAKQARPVRASPRHPGELVTPREARFARVATFFEPFSENGHCNNFSMGLRGERRSGQLLVYVDRVASIVGTHYRAPYLFEYQLRFPRAGLYLVGLRRTGFTLMPFIVADTERLLARIRPHRCSASGMAAAS